MARKREFFAILPPTEPLRPIYAPGLEPYELNVIATKRSGDRLVSVVVDVAGKFNSEFKRDYPQAIRKLGSDALGDAADWEQNAYPGEPGAGPLDRFRRGRQRQIAQAVARGGITDLEPDEEK